MFAQEKENYVSMTMNIVVRTKLSLLALVRSSLIKGQMVVCSFI
ncbi:hypothetical protein HMPREF9441_00674 [Paraprevotella clara YIT 11840]|uniref:Uncharacterized protein n=1 Tax=Paraprevotella clara YIT 11840 TaxID=762968 RepID=G5SMU7_9BACT|nr:hypothetical protein HMPREF9441_00674 [Paraprevotella clara YIT 11840]